MLVVGGDTRAAIRAAITASDLASSVDDASIDDAAAALGDKPGGRDCIILAPDRGGLDAAFAFLRGLREARDPTPVLVVLPAPEDELLQAAVDAGATDYILADGVSPRRIAMRIRSALRLGRAEAESTRSLAGATAAARARDEILAIVSHDLRGPLHAISLACEALAGDIPDTGQRYIGAIERAMVRAERLICDLLDANAVENGALSINRRPIDAIAVLRQAVADHEPAVRDSGGTVEARLPSGAVSINADRDRILQALANLIGNAIKHARGAAIEVALARGDTNATFTVRDRGPGIGPNELPHVFDRYWRGRTRKGGAGLGLAIARGIVEAHAGTIQVTSVPGEGAAFSFTLPLA